MNPKTEREMQTEFVASLGNLPLPVIEELYIVTSAARWKYESRPDVIVGRIIEWPDWATFDELEQVLNDGTAIRRLVDGERAGFNWRTLLMLLYGFMDLTVYELKLTAHKKAFDQAERYSIFADRTSIVMPSRYAANAIRETKHPSALISIGVIERSTDGTFRTKRKPSTNRLHHAGFRLTVMGRMLRKWGEKRVSDYLKGDQHCLSALNVPAATIRLRAHR